jgi:hypothetical protein
MSIVASSTFSIQTVVLGLHKDLENAEVCDTAEEVLGVGGKVRREMDQS